MVFLYFSSSAYKPRGLGCYFLLHGVKTPIIFLEDCCGDGELKGNGNRSGANESRKLAREGVPGSPILTLCLVVDSGGSPPLAGKAWSDKHLM